MATWWNEGKYVIVTDRTPQSLMNRSSLISVDPHRALTGPELLTPAPGAELTPGVHIRRNKCSQKEKLYHCWHRDIAVTHALYVWASHPLFENSVNCFRSNVFRIRPVVWNRRVSLIKCIHRQGNQELRRSLRLMTLNSVFVLQRHEICPIATWDREIMFCPLRIKTHCDC